jgi:hypothetical protein
MKMTAKAKALKASAALDASAFVGVIVPPGEPKSTLTIQAPSGTYTAAVNSKSLRKVVTAVTEAEDRDAMIVIVQGVIEGTTILEAGISVVVKAPKPATAEAA